MADLLVNLIADNTDPETEPNPNFRYFYNYSENITIKERDQRGKDLRK